MSHGFACQAGTSQAGTSKAWAKHRAVLLPLALAILMVALDPGRMQRPKQIKDFELASNQPAPAVSKTPQLQHAPTISHPKFFLPPPPAPRTPGFLTCATSSSSVGCVSI